MKIYAYCLLTIFAFAVRATADESLTNIWGTMTNGAQMSIALKDGAMRPTTNTVILTVRIRNVSTNKNFYLYEANGYLGNPNFYFTVNSPAGKKVIPKLIKPADSGGIVNMSPNEAIQFEFNLSELYEFHEMGVYRVNAYYWMQLNDGNKQLPFTVISNPLDIRVISEK